MPKVYEVVVDGPGDGGAAGDGSRVLRFSKRVEADDAAEGATYYGKPATVTESEVDAKLLRRWRNEGKIQ